jgi:hypothetical protein
VTSGVERASPEELAADVREHSWGDGAGVRCAGVRSKKAPVLEAAAQVSPLRLVVLTGAACVACVLAAAAAAAAAPACACAVFFAACVLGGAVVDEGGAREEGRVRCSCQEKATGAKSAHRRIPHPPMATGRDMRSLTMPMLSSSSVAPPGHVDGAPRG